MNTSTRMPVPGFNAGRFHSETGAAIVAHVLTGALFLIGGIVGYYAKNPVTDRGN